MLKPKLAPGSKTTGCLVAASNDVDVLIDSDGDLLMASRNGPWHHQCYVHPLDAIRALVDGGKLPLWDAAVRLKEARDRYTDTDVTDEATDELEALMSRIDALCDVVDEMGETT